MSIRNAENLKKLIDENGAILSIAGENMKITSTELTGDYLKIKCGRYGTELGGEEDPIPFIKSVRKGRAVHLHDLDGEVVSLHF